MMGTNVWRTGLVSFFHGRCWLPEVAAAGAAVNGFSLTAIFRQVTEKAVHGRIFGNVNERAPLPLKRDESGLPQLIEVEGQGGRRQRELFADPARRQALASRLHQQAEHIETGLLRQGGESGYCICLFHISKIMEMLWAVNRIQGGPVAVAFVLVLLAALEGPKQALRRRAAFPIIPRLRAGVQVSLSRDLSEKSCPTTRDPW